jgi:hypothetical protein
MATKFNLNRPAVPDEEINSHKDFGELVNKFKAESIQKARSDVSFLKSKKATYSAIIAGVTVICTVTYFAVFKKDPPKQTANDTIITSQQNTSNISQIKPNKAFIAPPISKLNVPYTSYKVKAEQGAKIVHKQSKIYIPKNAFVNKQGQDIIGDVDIQYREFHDQADIIASGIPMAYDSAGIKSTLESAGMFDIKGFQNGEQVYVNPKKAITVELASNNATDKFNQYVLDTIARNWVYMKRDVLGNKETIGTKKTEEIDRKAINESEKIVEIQKQLNAIPPKIEAEKVVYTKKVNLLPKSVQPTKPIKSTEGRPQFELDVNYKEFPELEAFKNAVFEVGAENKNYNAKLSEITWSSAEISEGPQKGKNYLVTLKLRERVEKLVVYLALTGANYDKAIASYEKKFSEYTNLVTKREADEKKLKEEFEAKQQAYLAEQKKLNDELVRERIKIRQEQDKQFAEQFSTMGNQQRIMRTFQVSNFGIYNSDCPNSMPKGASVNPIYVINNGASFVTPTTTYLVCHTKNIVYNLYANAPLSYDPEDSYSLCVIANGKMYVCSKELFSALAKEKQNKIPLLELSVAVNDVSDFKKALGI